MRRNLLAAYWLAGIIAGGHVAGGLAGIFATVGWPVYASAKMWGRWA